MKKQTRIVSTIILLVVLCSCEGKKDCSTNSNSAINLFSSISTDSSLNENEVSFSISSNVSSSLATYDSECEPVLIEGLNGFPSILTSLYNTELNCNQPRLILIKDTPPDPSFSLETDLATSFIDLFGSFLFQYLSHNSFNYSEILKFTVGGTIIDVWFDPTVGSNTKESIETLFYVCENGMIVFCVEHNGYEYFYTEPNAIDYYSFKKTISEYYYKYIGLKNETHT